MSTLFSDQDLFYMEKALKEAQKAALKEEVPVGGLAVYQGEVLAKSHNLKESRQNALSHAEMILIEKCSRQLKRWRLSGVTFYVTLEPCLMCMGALLQARVDRLVFAAFDPKAGACGSLYDFSEDTRLNHRIEVVSGPFSQESAKLLSGFFRDLREKKKKKILL